MRTRIKLTLLCGFACADIMAQVPGILSFQGRVTVNGTNFDGTGQFKFALVDAGRIIERPPLPPLFAEAGGNIDAGVDAVAGDDRGEKGGRRRQVTDVQEGQPEGGEDAAQQSDAERAQPRGEVNAREAVPMVERKPNTSAEPRSRGLAPGRTSPGP